MSQHVQIILVDDDIDDRQITTSALNDAEIRVPYLYLENGVMLLEYLENTTSDKLLPALIVLDMHMPILSGLDVIRILKEHPRYRPIPVVMFSISLTDEDRQACMDCGAVDYIDKPNNYNSYKGIVAKFHGYCNKNSSKPVSA